MAISTQLHMQLPKVAAERLQAYCDSTGRRRTDVILQLIGTLKVPAGARPLAPSAHHPRAPSASLAQRSPVMVVWTDAEGDQVVFWRPTKLATDWKLVTLQRTKDRSILPEVVDDAGVDVWSLLEAGEAVKFDDERPEHHALVKRYRDPALYYPEDTDSSEGLAEFMRERAERIAREDAEAAKAAGQGGGPAASAIAALEDEDA